MPETRFILSLMGQRTENVHAYGPDPDIPGCTEFIYANGERHTHGPGAIFEIGAIETTPEGHRFGARGRCTCEGCEARDGWGQGDKNPCPWSPPPKIEDDDDERPF